MASFKQFLNESKMNLNQSKGFKKLDTTLKKVDEALNITDKIYKYLNKKFGIKNIDLGSFIIENDWIKLNVELDTINIMEFKDKFNIDTNKAKKMMKDEEDKVKKMGGNWLQTLGDLHINLKF